MPRTLETREGLRRLLLRWAEANAVLDEGGALGIEAQILGLTLIEDELKEAERGEASLSAKVVVAKRDGDLIGELNWGNRLAQVREDVEGLKQRLANGEEYVSVPADWPKGV